MHYWFKLRMIARWHYGRFPVIASLVGLFLVISAEAANERDANASQPETEYGHQLPVKENKTTEQSSAISATQPPQNPVNPAKGSMGSNATRPSTVQQPHHVGAMAQAADKLQQGLAYGVTETAQWIDSFFADPEYPKEDVDVRLDLRQYFTWLESHPNEHKTRVSAQVRLPSFSERISLTFDGNDEQEDRLAKESVADSIRDVDENPNLGLQYLKQVDEDYSQRVKLGYRFSRRTAYLGGRLRKVWPMADDARFRVSQRLRWYKRDGWENQTLIDYETMLSEETFFQQRFKVLWQEYLLTEQGTRYQVASSMVYPFSDNAAIRWNWTSDYQTRPVKDWTSSQLSLSYRRQFWRDWMYLEVGPFIRWQNEQNWYHDYGFNLTFQFIIEQIESSD